LTQNRQVKMETIHKTRTGVVISNKMDKTVVVGVETVKRHRLYKKNVRRIVKYKAHDPLKQCNEGDTVRITEYRPISKEKHWRVTEILIKHEKIEVKPKEVV
jgi:small subunit ribosomal protein S17